MGFGLPLLLTKELKMARGHNLRGSFPVNCTSSDCFFYAVRFETNDSAAPDGITQASDGVTIARASTGNYTITFPTNRRPLAMLWGNANFEESAADYSARVVSYTASTGVLVIEVYYDDGSPAVADTNDKTVAVCVLFSRKTANA